MRFIIHGAGAIGSLIGGKLADIGSKVILIGRKPHVDAINKCGLIIKDNSGEKVVGNIEAITSPDEIKPGLEDVIFLTVKTAQTSRSVQALREVFSGDTPIFCFQNGIRNEELAARRFMRVYGAMAGLSVNFLGPGRIAQTMSNRIGIGYYPFGCDEPGIRVADKLSEAGFSMTTHDSIMDVKWSKLLLNLNNATYAIIDCYMQLGVATPIISRFMADVVEEGLHIIEKAGIVLDDPDNPYDITAYIEGLRAVKEDSEKVHNARNLSNDLRTYPSTWMDLKQKRGETEAGYFNGEIVLLGEKHNIPTPFNTTLLNIVETMASERIAPGRYSIEELADLVEQKRLMLYQG